MQLLSADFLYIYPSPTGNNTITLCAEDLNTLQPGALLNDKVVNLWLRHIRSGCEKTAANVLVMDSYFMTLLHDMFKAESENIGDANDIFNKLLRFDGFKLIFEHTFVLFPYCQRSHWSLLLLKNKACKGSARQSPAALLHFDSRPGLHRSVDTLFRSELGACKSKMGVEAQVAPHSLSIDRLVPLASYPDFVVDQMLLLSRSEETQKHCHSCNHRLWDLQGTEGGTILVCKKRAAVDREGFIICQAQNCPQYAGAGDQRSRRIFCLRCTTLRERGGGAIAFDACFGVREGGGFEQLLQECLHCRSGSGKQCKRGDTDDSTCPRLIHQRDFEKPQKRTAPIPDTKPLAPYAYPGLRYMASHLPWLPLPDQWFSTHGLAPEPVPRVRLPWEPYPHHWLFFSPKQPPKGTPFHTLLPTSPKHGHRTHLWPFPELPPQESVFYVHPSSCLPPAFLACEPASLPPEGLSYEPQPPYSSGVFFYGRDPSLFALFEAAKDAPQSESRKHAKRSPEVKVQRCEEIPAAVYTRELPLLVEAFRARAAQGCPLHTGPLRGNYMLIANIEQKWEGEGGERALRARIVEPDLKTGAGGKNPVRTLWPVKVRFGVASGGGTSLTCNCKLKGPEDKCYHVGVLEALTDLSTLDVWTTGTTHEGVETVRRGARAVNWRALEGQSTVALTYEAAAVTIYIVHSGSSGTLVARRELGDSDDEAQTAKPRGRGGKFRGRAVKQGQAANPGDEWFCEACTLGQMDLHGRCIHSYQLAGLTKEEWQPQGEGVRVPETAEEVWGLNFGVKPYPKLGTAATIVCTSCPRGADRESAKVTQARTCPHLASLSPIPTVTPRSAEDLRTDPIIFGEHLKVAHVCTHECQLRPCGQLPPRDNELNQAAEQGTSLEDTRRWSREGRFCQARPVTPAPCGAPWHLKWNGEGRLIKANALHAIDIGTWWCGRCRMGCTLKYDAAADGLYYLTPQTLVTQEVLKSMEDDLLQKAASFQQIVRGWEGKALRTFTDGEQDTRMLCEDKARQGIERYLQHLDDHLVEQWRKEARLEPTSVVERPPHKPEFKPESGQPGGKGYVLFVPPENPLDLKDALLTKFFRADDRVGGHAGGDYEGRVSGYNFEKEQWKIAYDDEDRETMCFKELAPLVHTLPEGYVDNNPDPTGRGHPVPPFAQTIGANVLLQRPTWNREYRGQVMERVGPRPLSNGESGYVYQVKFEDDTVEDLEFEEVKAARQRFQDSEFGNSDAPTLTQVLQAAPLSPYSLQCLCSDEDPVLLLPTKGSKQTVTEKMKLIPRGVKRKKDKKTGQPIGPKTGPRTQLLRWSQALVMWPEDSKKVTAGTPIEGNEVFKSAAEYVAMLPQLPRCVRRLVEYVVGAGHGITVRKMGCPEGPWRNLFYHLGSPESDDVLICKDVQSTVLRLLLGKSAGPVTLTADQRKDLREKSPVLAKVLQEGAQMSDGGYWISKELLDALESLLIHLLQMSYFAVDLDCGTRAVELLKEALAASADWGAQRGEHLERYVEKIERLMYRKFWFKFMEEKACNLGPNALSYAQNAARLCSYSVVRPVTQNPALDKVNGRALKSQRNKKCTGNYAPNVEPRLKKSLQKKVENSQRYIDNLAIMSCGHGVVLDYIIGLEPESVKDVIVYLETRFKYHPPKLIINDNSCQVERNGKLRNPNFIAGSSFCLDGFHGYGHRCTRHYILGERFPEAKDETSVVEHINDWLADWEKVFYNMRTDTLQLLLNFIIRARNHKKNEAFRSRLLRLN
ncbi:hypothetical protein KFL_003500145 [Klebsormidium nitens]|uniref:Ubiquitin-like protease family profile domain-containing protein n=1 Tax=Klebsormidium nitens TaxID=105231 RepID=A0A1Y1IA08_KLENI|nr:hypothetical protein KFL_003500145 [Klebsormidium nitens]|eukprot:GAQ87403.1 hypothetical protein KFL_003500145 [Klebsormidium nitens]